MTERIPSPTLITDVFEAVNRPRDYSKAADLVDRELRRFGVTPIPIKPPLPEPGASEGTLFLQRLTDVSRKRDLIHAESFDLFPHRLYTNALAYLLGHLLQHSPTRERNLEWN